MPLLDDLVFQLEADGVGTWNVDIFTSSRATIPVTTTGTLQLIETGGTSPENTQNATVSPAFLKPSVQIVARGKTKVAVEALAWRAFQSMYGIRNRFIQGNWYRLVRPLQSIQDLGLDDRGELKYAFNVLVSYNRRGDTAMNIYQLIDELGGDPNAFLTPAASDVYPVGATFDKLVPGSVPVLLDRRTLYPGSYVLEASARASETGARVKLALVNLTVDPDAPVVEISFTTNEVLGERKRSTAFDLLDSSNLYGVKLTVNSDVIGGAAWGIRLLRV